MVAMAKSGFDGASISDIAKAARLTPGLVHYHFKDKLEILAALAHQVADENQRELDLALEQTRADPIHRLNAIIDFYLSLSAAADPVLLACWIALSGEAIRHSKIRVIFARTLAGIHAEVSRYISLGIEQKTIRASTEPDDVAAMLVATIQGYFVLAGTARDLIPKGSAARTTKQMLKGLIER